MRRFLAVGGFGPLFSLLGMIGGWPTHGSNPAGLNSALADAPDGSGKSGAPTLTDILDKGLKARLPTEFAFVDEVVSKVNDGTLPKPLVDSTFLWARKKEKHEFQYFQQGLIIRAKQIGVAL